MKKIIFIYIFSFFVFSVSSQISRISYFNAIILGNDVRLDFTISKGPSCSGYQVYKSTDSLTYNLLFDYAGICGNTSTDQQISYTDGGVPQNTFLYYKILIPPFDYSKVARLYVDQKKTKKAQLYIYPQPVENIFTVYLEGQNPDDYTVKIFTYDGLLKIDTYVNAYQYLKIDISTLERGIYCLLLIDSAGNYSRGKVIKI